MEQSSEQDEDSVQDSDVDMDADSTDGDTQMTEGSFVKVGDKKAKDEDALDGVDDSDPDVYDVNVVAWDTPVSALHLAVLGGHVKVIRSLASNFGADVLLPVKLVDSYSRNPSHAIMTLILAAQISDPKSLDVTTELLSLGASSAQGDMHQVTSFHYLVVERRVELLKACIEHDGAAAKEVLNHIILENAYWKPRADTPLTTAIRSGDMDLVSALLSFGAKPAIDLDDFATAYRTAQENKNTNWPRREEDDISGVWKTQVQQPIFLAMDNDMPEITAKLLEIGGGDINTLDTKANETIKRFNDHVNYSVWGGSLLDAVEAKISHIESTIGRKLRLPEPIDLEDDQAYLSNAAPGSYEHWYLSKTVEITRNVVKAWRKERKNKLDEEENRSSKQKKIDALKVLKKRFLKLRDELLEQVCHLRPCLIIFIVTLPHGECSPWPRSISQRLESLTLILADSHCFSRGRRRSSSYIQRYTSASAAGIIGMTSMRRATKNESTTNLSIQGYHSNYQLAIMSNRVT